MLPSKLIIPQRGLEPVEFDLHVPKVHLTDYGLDFVRENFKKAPGIHGGSGQFSAWAEQQIVNHANGQDNASWGNLSPVYVALCTVVPTSSSTGSTITEASYTTYARTSVPNTSWASASGTAPASGSNTAAITGPACTAGTATVIAAAVCTASTVGNVIYWFSVASTVISTSATPPTFAIGAVTLSQT